MGKLRRVLAGNLRAYRNEKGLSQFKLAEMVDTAPNYIAMIEAEKRFPTDKMAEKIAVALNCDPCDLFSIKPIQKNWQKTLLTELTEVMNRKLNDLTPASDQEGKH